MFLIPVVLVDIHGRVKHVFVSLRHTSLCTHKEGFSASRLLREDVGGGDV